MSVTDTAGPSLLTRDIDATLERVLCGEDVKRARQVVPLAGDRVVVFLHRLQEG